MFLKNKMLWSSPRGERSCNGLFRQSRWSDHNEVKTGGCTYLFSLFYIFFSPAILYAVIQAIVGFSRQPTFYCPLNMYHLITFQLFLKKTFCHMQSIQHQSIKHFSFFATVLSVILKQFFIAKRTMVLYNLNMVHLICKAYSK